MGITKTLTPIDVDGKVMYDLNEIHKEWQLPTKRLPSQWRHRDRTHFELNAFLHAIQIPGKQGSSVAATQEAVYAYASWVSPEFFLAVIKCFTAVVNGDVEQAKTIAAHYDQPRDCGADW